jgi:putative membrane protein insertion efficiency factor
MIARLAASLLVAGVFIGAAVDVGRPPSEQITARCYQTALEGYHALVHPVTGRFIRCRYRPTCSHYSGEAVARFGIVRGLKLTFIRLLSCRASVPPGTPDPVPVN